MLLSDDEFPRADGLTDEGRSTTLLPPEPDGETRALRAAPPGVSPLSRDGEIAFPEGKVLASFRRPDLEETTPRESGARRLPRSMAWRPSGCRAWSWTRLMRLSSPPLSMWRPTSGDRS